MYKVSFYVPKQDLERVKSALFHAGAGRIGQYFHCAWQTLGEGQFKPLEGSNPSVGELNGLGKIHPIQEEAPSTGSSFFYQIL